jgi:hypothetical protein
MKFKNLLQKRFFLIIVCILSLSTLMAQSPAELARVKQSINKSSMDALQTQFNKQYQQDEQKVARYLATHQGVPRSFVKNTSFFWMKTVDAFGIPVYINTKNLASGQLIKADQLYAGGSLGVNITGTGMVAGVWDGGQVRATHELLAGRVAMEPGQTLDGSANNFGGNNHMTHVSGTIVGKNIANQPSARGIAHNATAKNYDWAADKAEMVAFAAGGFLISNHSYGYANDNTTPLWQFGAYDSEAQAWDVITKNAPNYLPFVAAGNEQQNNGNPTKNGYDLITGSSAAKNVITVGAINGDLTMSDYSNWGPTDDGRVKPDIVAKGTGINSSTFADPVTNLPSDNSYSGNGAGSSGTSYASPAAAASGLLLQQYHNSVYAAYLKSSTLKTLMLGTATDLGQPGPDPKFGWGVLNIEKAAKLIKYKTTGANPAGVSNNNTANQNYAYIEEITFNPIANSSDEGSRDVIAGGCEPLIISIGWTDDEGPEQTAAQGVDPTTGRLVYDFDFMVRNMTTSVDVRPWKPVSMVDRLNNAGICTSWFDVNNNNFKQVIITNPTPGQLYRIFFRKKAGSPEAVRIISLVVSGIRVLAPTGNANQTFCGASTLANLVVTGTGVKWYDASTMGTQLPLNTALTNGTTYHASQTIEGCESNIRLAVTVSASNNTVALTSAVGTNSQTVAVNTAITNITYATTGATGATVTGLPAGVTGGWAANVVTISGTPTAAGTFNYTVTLTGGCGAVTATGTITVNPIGNTITLTSAAGTNSQTVCINTAITAITYSTTGATGATFSGLPAGVTGNWEANVVIISGTPTASGTFTYTVTLTGGSGTGTATGTMTVNALNAVTLTSAAGTNAQTVVVNTPITNITYAATGATGATVTGLPAGVTGGWAANVVTINGTPTAAGTFNYTVTLTGGCGTITAMGTITVNPAAGNTITLTSAAGTNGQAVCISTAITAITYSTTGATGATFSGLPPGVTGAWAANVVTISGTPTASGTFNYTVTLTGGSGTGTATGTIAVNALNTVTLTSAAGTNAQTVIVNTPITNITYATTGATGATVTGLPAGVTGGWAVNVVTINGTPTAVGTFNYTVTLTGGCGAITATGTITVNPLANTITLTSAAGTNAQTVCKNTPITNITYATTGATGATFSGLPASVTGVWAINVVTISGTPTISGTFNYTITLTGGSGTGTATGTITVTEPPAATIAYTGSPYCSNAGTANVTRTGTAGGTYSSAAGLTLNAATGAVTLGTSTPGTYTVTYTMAAGGGCPSATTNTTITITQLPAATISYAGTPYCSTDLTAPVTRTGTAGGTYSSTAGLTINAATGTVTPQTSTPGTYTVTYTIAAAGGCGAVTATTSITITAAPNMIIFYAGTPYCSSAGTATVSQFGTTGGTYSASPAGLVINAATGAVTLGTSTAGTYTVTYTIAASGGCGATITTTTITVTAAPAATIAYTGSPYCSNAGTANVTRTGTAGGTYSSTAGLTINAATGAVTLGTSTPGTYTVTYTVDAAGGCATFTTIATITITTLPAATISYAGSPYCSNAGTATVTRTGTAGGTFSSTAGLSITAATGDVNLGASTAGTYTVTYTLAAGGGCPAVTATTTITITTLPAATITYAGSPYCPVGTATVTRTGTAGGTYSATPAGLVISSTTGTVTLNTSTAGTYTVSYTLAAGGGCPAVVATATIVVQSLSVAATAATTSAGNICGPQPVTLSVTGGSLGSGASWKWYSGSCGGTAVGTGASIVVTPAATTTYFVRAEGTCNTTTCASVTVTVDVQPTISIAASITALIPGRIATITATVTPATGTTITWYLNGNVVAGATGTTITVGVDGIGQYTARITTGAGCTALSNAVAITGAANDRLFITPNPNHGQFKVRYFADARLGFGYNRRLLIYAEGSQKVFDLQYQITGPWSSMDIDARHLPKGIYVVMLTDGYGVEILATGRVVLQ